MTQTKKPETDKNGAVLGFVSVGSDRRYLEGQLTALENFVDRLELCEIVDGVKEFTVI